MIKPDNRIVFKFYTPRDAFLAFLKTARASEMNHIPDLDQDDALVAAMMYEDSSTRCICLVGFQTWTTLNDLMWP